MTLTIVATVSSSSTVARDMTWTWTIVTGDTTATTTTLLWTNSYKSARLRNRWRDPYRLSALWWSCPFNNEVFALMFASILSFDRCLKVNENRSSAWSKDCLRFEGLSKKHECWFSQVTQHTFSFIRMNQKSSRNGNMCTADEQRAPPSSVKRILGDMTRCSSSETCKCAWKETLGADDVILEHKEALVKYESKALEVIVTGKFSRRKTYFSISAGLEFQKTITWGIC